MRCQVHQSCWGFSTLQHIVLLPLIYLAQIDTTKLRSLCGTLESAQVRNRATANRMKIWLKNNQKILLKCNDGMS
ncbi:hypothetical protein EUGRSUZ_A00715 [Eucalyptus grandis]|uniref:Uncharacterized protein n=2 Tax=Eucalyptus grandis TaxID=71139 RepID=A0ACC3M0T0_EUCGR|nr:hypothetical protein EUGRSUZ_A00715 [Eucalyptus grandis]